MGVPILARRAVWSVVDSQTPHLMITEPVARVSLVGAGVDEFLPLRFAVVLFRVVADRVSHVRFGHVTRRCRRRGCCGRGAGHAEAEPGRHSEHDQDTPHSSSVSVLALALVMTILVAAPERLSEEDWAGVLGTERVPGNRAVESG
jgi:hypothetical protein